jgi:hypothetical protein
MMGQHECGNCESTQCHCEPDLDHGLHEKGKW